MKPTRTINRLHFDDLSPERFEDLCLAIIYRMNRWLEIYHYGRTGADNGIDIFAVQQLDDNLKLLWNIQCKRFKSISSTELKRIVDKILKKNTEIPNVLLIIIACDVSKRSIDSYMKYSTEKGIKNPQIWTASILEAKLYSENHDLLFSYFGISMVERRNNRIATVRRNIRLKRRMHKDLLKPFDPNKRLRSKTERFISSEFLIRSIDDKIYPDIDDDTSGISSWFKIEPYNFYHNGLEVILDLKEIIVDENEDWDILNFSDAKRRKKYKTGKVFVIGQIPFENIIDYDLDGDEYYGIPHIFCAFNNAGTPYEDIIYVLIPEREDAYYYPRMDNSKRRILK